MPNWVLTNANVSGSGPDLQRFLDRFRESDGDIVFKFEKVVPMPKDLNENESNYSETGAIYVWLTEHPDEIPPSGLLKAKCKYRTFAELCKKCEAEFERVNKDIQQQMIEQGRVGLDSCIKYGAFSWYDWCYSNWGTKWDVNDAYVQEPLDPKAENGFICLSFLTAQSFPAPIFIELSKLYPGLTFEGEYAEDNYGSNCAEFTIKNGEIEIKDKESDQAFAYSVWGEEPKDDEDDDEEETESPD